MSHRFGDLISQHLHRRHGLSQSKLAAGILQEPTIITKMCKGQRLTGPQARERVVAMIDWLNQQGALDRLVEANALLAAANMLPLSVENAIEDVLTQKLGSLPATDHARKAPQPAHAHNLPAPATALIGREDDLIAVTKLLIQNAIRVITLIGPPGVGKTRLATQVALNAQNDYADGVWFVALASISDPGFISFAIMQALGLTDSGAPPLATLKSYLRDKKLLLVLDNFEQIIDAAPSIAEILAAAPGIKVLSTSRAALRISGEHIVDVPPLEKQAAAELFVRCAQAIKPSFTQTPSDAQMIIEICQHLDALPLAIELAAARIRMFEPSALLNRLSSQLSFLVNGPSDLPTRQRTLRNTIDWSYGLLSVEEQILFRRLGVFIGGCTLEMVEHIAGEDLHTPIVDLLQSLADKSLIRVESHEGEPRFNLLEMLREYSVEHLDSSGEVDTLKQCHAQYFVEFIERIQSKLSGHQAAPWIARLNAEQDNLRAVFSWSLKSNHIEAGLRLATALGDSWRIRGPLQEGWLWVTQLLAHPEARTYKLACASTFRTGSTLLTQLGDTAKSDLFADEALALFRVIEDKAAIAQLLADKGNNAWARADFEQARSLCHESASLFREIGDRRGMALALNWLGGTERDQGNFDKAIAIFNEVGDIAQEIDSATLTWLSVNSLAVLAYIKGDYVRAMMGFEEGRLLSQNSEFNIAANISMWGMGCVNLVRGNIAQAVANLQSATHMFRQHQDNESLSRGLLHLGFAKHLQDETEEGIVMLREGLRIQQTYKRKLLMIESLDRLAWIASDKQRHPRAARLFGSSVALRKQIGAVFPPGEMPFHKPRFQATQDALNEAVFAACWSEGQAMTFDQAVGYALGSD